MTFQIESHHTKQECLQALDDILAKGAKYLEKFDWGCAAGDHRGWAKVEAKDESEVKTMIPISLKYKTRVVPVTKFTPEQIRSYHKK